MQVIDIIEELKNLGHQVSYRKRSDGGYIITKIDGVNYTGAVGNNTARNMLGISMSDKELTQRRSNIEKFIKIPRTKTGKKKGHKAVDDFTDEEKNKIKKLQRLARKSKNKKGFSQGTITKKTARAYKKKYGEKALQELLNKRIRYYEGYAYESNVELLIERIGRLKLSFTNSNIIKILDECVSLLEANKNNIKEQYISEIYAKIYDIQKIKSEELIKALLNYIQAIVI